MPHAEGLPSSAATSPGEPNPTFSGRFPGAASLPGITGLGTANLVPPREKHSLGWGGGLGGDTFWESDSSGDPALWLVRWRHLKKAVSRSPLTFPQI